MNLKRLPLHWKIIIGMVLGVLFGFLMWGSASIGYIFMLNYVPSNNKESFMSLAYSLDGLIAGITTVLAGYLVLWLDTNNICLLYTSPSPRDRG